MSEVTQTQTAQPDQPMTIKHKIRLIGSIILLLAALGVANFWQQEVEFPVVEYNAATLTPEQVAKRDEILAQYRSWVDVVEVRGETRYLYNVGDQEWSVERPRFFDENDQPMLDEQDERDIAELAEDAIMMEKPAWLMQGSGTISIKDYNSNRNGLNWLIWIGFAFSVALYLVLFKWNHPSKDERGASRASAFGCFPLTLLILGPVAYIATPPWPYLIAFGSPFLSMFLLWALTRSGKDNAAVEEPAELGEATEPTLG